MWARKRIDIGWWDLAATLAECLRLGDAVRARRSLEDSWAGEQGLGCLSVRSGLDLYLAEANFPQGSEVLISAITIPDMVRIIEHHGLVAVPLDLDPSSAIPPVEQIAERVTDKAKAVLIAHLFGAVADLDEHIRVAHQHGLVFLEDCAQAFRGSGFTGHEQADLTFFSFGTIKTATALGGALIRVRDPDLCAQLRKRQAAYPLQSQRGFAMRCAKYLVLKLLSTRIGFRCLATVLRWSGKDHDRVLNAMARGFPPERLFELIRQTPCRALVNLLARRIRTFDDARPGIREARGARLVCEIDGSAECPGGEVRPHYFWIFPIAVDNPPAIQEMLFAHGFDSTQGQSMIVIDPPSGREALDPSYARRLLPRILYLPFYDSIPDRELERMARVVREAVASQGS